MRTRTAVAMLLALTLAPAIARADLITGTITGTITAAGSGVAGVRAGFGVSGSYTYDTSRVVSGPTGPVDPFTAFNLSIGTNPRTFGLGDLTPGDLPSGRLVGLGPGDELVFFFTDAAIQAFLGAPYTGQTNAPGTPERFFIQGTDADHSVAISYQTNVPTATVPAPASLLLAPIGLVSAWAARRRLRAAA